MVDGADADDRDCEMAGNAEVEIIGDGDSELLDSGNVSVVDDRDCGPKAGDSVAVGEIGGNPMDDGEVLSFSCEILLGLSELDVRSISAGDIQPWNVLLNKRKLLQICDFWLARVIGVSHDDGFLSVVTQ
jgi:serine/threonine protein kinase